MEKKRLVGLDVFRIVAAAMVFLFHSRNAMNYYYGRIHVFTKMGAIFMTGFFMLSGFALYYSNREKNLMQLSDMKRYYIKRFVGIMPAYYVVALLYAFIIGRESFSENLILAPIEILGLQSTVRLMFTLSHNSGTWFISCLVIFYLLYPFVQEVTKQLSLKARLILMALAGFVLYWIAIVIWKFKLPDIYTNPFFRGLEFYIGVLLASMKEELEKIKPLRFFQHWVWYLVELVILIEAVTYAVEADFAVGSFMTYDMICLPIFVMMIFTMSGVSSKILEKSKLLQYLTDISYMFFLAQFFTFDISWRIIKGFDWWDNKGNIMMSSAICIVIAIVLHELVEKPLKKLCMSWFDKRGKCIKG